MGGSINLEPKIKYDYRENSPGPGRYEPSLYLTKPRGFHYIFGEKLGTFSIKNLCGTNEMVGPSSYKMEQTKDIEIVINYKESFLYQNERKRLNEISKEKLSDQA